VPLGRAPFEFAQFEITGGDKLPDHAIALVLLEPEPVADEAPRQSKVLVQIPTSAVCEDTTEDAVRLGGEA
jgi:hypothetical protein